MFYTFLYFTIGRQVYLKLSSHQRPVNVSYGLSCNAIVRILVQHLPNKKQQMMRIISWKLSWHNVVNFGIIDSIIVIKCFNRMSERTSMKKHHSKGKYIGLGKVDLAGKLTLLWYSLPQKCRWTEALKVSNRIFGLLFSSKEYYESCWTYLRSDW